METRYNKLYRGIGPLPEGDRRGTSVAGHGRDSMLASGSRTTGCTGVGDAGGRGKSSRATAEAISRSRSATPAEDVSQETYVTQPANTKAGKPRVRMKWSEDINLFIMRTYFYITKLETDKTMYCKRLHERFRHRYPSLEVSSQRIADQRRVILRNRLLSEQTIDNIKKSVAEQLKQEEQDHFNTSRHNVSTTQQPTMPVIFEKDPANSDYYSISIDMVTNQQLLTTIRHQSCEASTQTNTLPDWTTLLQSAEQDKSLETAITNELAQKLNTQLETALIQYSGTDPTARPKLPRLKENKTLYDLVAVFNK